MPASKCYQREYIASPRNICYNIIKSCRLYATRLTSDTLISGLEIHSQLGDTRSGAEQVTVWNRDVARCFAGTRSVGVVQHVGIAAETVRVDFLQRRGPCSIINALTDAHASESRRCHDDDVTMTTAGTERLQLTVLTYFPCIILLTTKLML